MDPLPRSVESLPILRVFQPLSEVALSTSAGTCHVPNDTRNVKVTPRGTSALPLDSNSEIIAARVEQYSAHLERGRVVVAGGPLLAGTMMGNRHGSGGAKTYGHVAA